jgi:hypothetical protein
MLSASPQFIKWLSKLRKQYGKVYRIFTGNRAYVVLLDKVVSAKLDIMKIEWYKT